MSITPSYQGMKALRDLIDDDIATSASTTHTERRTGTTAAATVAGVGRCRGARTADASRTITAIL
jgi:hypothetical protein